MNKKVKLNNKSPKEQQKQQQQSKPKNNDKVISNKNNNQAKQQQQQSNNNKQEKKETSKSTPVQKNDNEKKVETKKKTNVNTTTTTTTTSKQNEEKKKQSSINTTSTVTNTNNNNENDDNIEDESISLDDKQIMEIQMAIDDLEKSQMKESLKLEYQRDQKLKPIFEKRNKQIELIDQFWYKTFSNHPIISSLLNEKDSELLSTLISFKVETINLASTTCTKFIFMFGNNNYLKNKLIYKEFKIDEDGEIEANASKLQWKNGNDITLRSSEDEEPSFFSFFDPNDTDTELLQILKNDIWMNPLMYYLDDDVDGRDEQ